MNWVPLASEDETQTSKQFLHGLTRNTVYCYYKTLNICEIKISWLNEIDVLAQINFGLPDVPWYLFISSRLLCVCKRNENLNKWRTNILSLCLRRKYRQLSVAAKLFYSNIFSYRIDRRTGEKKDLDLAPRF